jgi:nitrogen fixation/metabolism regulation signal transduction histidine kinase
MGTPIINTPARFKIIKSIATGFVPMAIFSILLLISLFVLAFAAEEINAESSSYYIGLLIFNAIGLLIIAIFIAINTWSLYEQIRRQTAGSRLTARLVLVFVLLSIVPVSLVFAFSVRFINNSIDTWFDVRVEQAMEYAIDLSRDSLGVQMRTYVKDSQRVTNEIGNISQELYVTELDRLRQKGDASEFTLLTKSNRVVASSSDKLLQVIPSRPSENILLQVKQGAPYFGLDQSKTGLVINVVLPFVSKINGEKLILMALYPVHNSMKDQAKKVEEGVTQYKRLVFLRVPLKISYILTLSLMLLMSVLTSVLAAFYFARKMMEPVNTLVAGTKEVADGNYDTRLPASSNDELGFLVQSFNIMTFRLQNADIEIRNSQKMLERQRLYLQTVLSSLSSGVMTFNNDCILQVYNDKASELLETDLQRFEGREVSLISARSDLFKQFLDQIKQKVVSKSTQWQEQIQIFTSLGRRILLCKGTNLPVEIDEKGVVIVIDDITELLGAQKQAAWSEVARRLAHEIKNPLTPIQLATERIRKKYITQENIPDSKLIDKCTLTIIKQVQSMEKMVKSFAEYANMPKQILAQVNVNQIVDEVVTLYQTLNENIQWQLDLDVHMKETRLDESRIRQVLANIIKNAIESQQENDHPWVGIKTHWITVEKTSFLEIIIEDRGEGIAPDIRERMFEPYNTSKPEGTGLGLAIVKNIIEESGGLISVENAEPNGALFRIKLPSINEL